MKILKTAFMWILLTFVLSIPVVSLAQTCGSGMAAGNTYGSIVCTYTGEDANYCYYSCDMSHCGSPSNCNKILDLMDLEPVS